MTALQGPLRSSQGKLGLRVQWLPRVAGTPGSLLPRHSPQGVPSVTDAGLDPRYPDPQLQFPVGNSQGPGLERLQSG